MNKAKGFSCVITAAVIFGFMPILSKLTYFGGSNPIMLVFLRSFLCIPILYSILRVKKITIKVPKKILFKFFIYSIVTTTLTALLLYTSYNYVSVGIATTIHYVYPIIVGLILVIFFKEKISILKIICLAISFSGILLFFDGNTSNGSLIGLFIAFLSGVSYSLSLIYMDKGGIKGYYPFLVTFYSCLFTSITMFFVSIITKSFTLSITPSGWLYSFILSIIVSVIAVTFMQIGVQNIGPTTTAILCMFEPITSIILAILLFNEPCTFRNILGCSLIIFAVLLLTIFDNKKESISNNC
ncbi:DMT family transporter [Sedimentibacter sp. zth1]|uniref:DMT family transporter n=1 Tax=Sedimentibacter sp. zth1 TaxID=2816908 RepID=UPI001A9253C5|nr:DMT family transporter [Sedimentibacter sp. zth1]QSX05033.1 DMT family transporter [Sedimentibacter sp. zth1]